MALSNRRNISLYEEAKAELISLIKQTALVGVGFLVMLLLTGGYPPAFVMGLSVCLGIVFVAWSEKKRIKDSKESYIPVEDIQEDNDKSRLIQEILTEVSIGRDLKDTNLSGADLSRADLIYAKLSRANLSGANLSGADLSRADLIYANLSGANLSGANLSGADLRGANLNYADLRGADLRGADLIGADLIGADLSGAIVEKGLFRKTRGLTEDTKQDLKQRGAIFEDFL